MLLFQKDVHGDGMVKTAKRSVDTVVTKTNVFILMERAFLDVILVMKATYANQVS